MSVSDINDKAALLVVGLLGYLANHAVAGVESHLARLEAHITAVDAVAQANKLSLLEVRTVLRERKILP